jgi:hypothetical protein
MTRMFGALAAACLHPHLEQDDHDAQSADVGSRDGRCDAWN